MDPRYQQWQNYRPSRTRIQPAGPKQNQEHSNQQFVRPIPRPNQWQSQKQTRVKKGCCGGGRSVTQ